MKNIYLYSPYWSDFGGGERYMLYLASALSNLREVKVILLSEFPEITKGQLSRFLSFDLSKIEYRVIKDSAKSLRKFVNRDDIFLSLSNFKTLKANPQHYVQALQIPYGKITIPTVARKIFNGNVKEGAKDVFRLQLLSHARNHTRLVIVNSQFVQDTLLRNFDLKSQVLYPPIEDFFDKNIQKRRIILSVGRFFKGLYNEKRYDVLINAFKRFNEVSSDWEYHIVGSVSSDKESQKYLDELKEAVKGYSIFFHVNAPHESLKEFYNQATIYWHGAGYRVDEIKYPERTEHFGMSVAEAMTAKCIPIVVNKGGLKEIVHHGTSGFLWETTEELISYTIKIADLSLEGRNSFAEKAREKCIAFSPLSFEERVKEIFMPLLALKE